MTVDWINQSCKNDGKNLSQFFDQAFPQAKKIYPSMENISHVGWFNQAFC